MRERPWCRLLKLLGGFDEGYLNGFEDVDFCLKVREGGGKVVYQPNSMLYHLEQQTPGRKNPDAEQKNYQLFMERWGDKIPPDEDIYYVSEGYKNSIWVKDGRLRVKVQPFTDGEEKTQWNYLSHVQKLLLQERYSEERQFSIEEKEELKILLSDSSQWPKHVDALAWAAKVCRKHGFHESEDRFWTQILGLENNAEARQELASHALEQNDLSLAAQQIQALLEIDSNNGLALCLQGILLMQSQQYSEASESFRRALALGFDSLKAGKGLGMAYLGMGEADKSWVEYHKVLSMFPDDVEVVNGLIQAGTALEHWSELAEVLGRFLERNPTNIDIRFTLASVEFRAGRFQAAQEQFSWLRLFKPDYEGLENLGKLLDTAQAQGKLVAHG